MTMPPPFVHGGSLHRAAEALQEEVKEAQWESSASLTVRRRTEPQARQMGQMTAGGVAIQNLQQEELHGRDRREHAVAPPGIADLATHRENSFGLQQRGPLACKSLQYGGDTWDHGVTSCTMGVLMP